MCDCKCRFYLAGPCPCEARLINHGCAVETEIGGTTVSKTMIVAWITALLGFLGSLGIDIPQTAADNMIGGVDGLFVVIGAVMIWLRMITDSPLAKGLRGLFGLKDE
jgi:hypothetical protein